MFANVKAKAWWLLGDRFRRTWEHVSGVKAYPADELISLRHLRGQADFGKLMAELNQPTYAKTESGKVKVVKTPKGYRSPNVADALAIRYMDARRKAVIW
jgi:hypothetical protein